jgi:hypothetical protein
MLGSSFSALKITLSFSLFTVIAINADFASPLEEALLSKK